MCFFVPQSNSRNILRIGLHSLGSALWGDDLCCYDSPKNGHSLTTFLYGLRALLRSSLSVAVVTVPSHLMQVRCITWLKFSKTWWHSLLSQNYFFVLYSLNVYHCLGCQEKKLVSCLHIFSDCFCYVWSIKSLKLNNNSVDFFVHELLLYPCTCALFFIHGAQTKFEAFCGGASSWPCVLVSPWYESESWGRPSPPRISPSQQTQLSAQFIQKPLCLCLFVWLPNYLELYTVSSSNISLLGVHLWLCCGLCVRVCIDVCICGRGCKSACMRLCTVWPLSVKVESSAEAYGRPQPSPRHLTIELHLQEKPSETK